MLSNLAAVGLAVINLGAWVYGIYCYVQAFRWRRRGLPHYGLILTSDQVQGAGHLYLRRWIGAWLVGLGSSVIGTLLL